MGRGKETELLKEKLTADLSRKQLPVKGIKRVEICEPVILPVGEIKINGETGEAWNKKYINYREIEKYYSELANKFDRVETQKERLSGMPAVKGTRIPISLIMACLKDEMTFGEICEEYGLTKKDIEDAVEFVIQILDAPYQEGLE